MLSHISPRTWRSGRCSAPARNDNPEPVVGVEALAEASRRARAHGIPLVAIGGIDYERAREVARYAELGAVIAALASLELARVPARASELNAIFGAESRLSPHAS